MHPVLPWFAQGLVPPPCVRLMSAQCPTTAPAMKRPSTQSPFARSWRSLHRGAVFRPLGGSSPSTLRSSLLRTHATIPRALLSFGFWPRSRSLCRLLTNPRYPRDLPDVILRIFLQMPEPLPRRFAECVCLVLPQHSSAFPRDKSGRRPAVPREHDFPRIRLQGCSYFFMFSPPRLLAPQIVPTSPNTPAGRPSLFRPSRTCVVAFARI